MSGSGPRAGGRYVDATIGNGGHAAAILGASAPDGRLLGLDADSAAVDVARARLADFGDRATIVNASFRALDRVVDEQGFGPVDGILMDLGISSRQLDAGGRGFTFRYDEPLDMRFDPTRGESAADLLNRADEAEIADILYRYGEEYKSRRVARAIVRQRERAPIATSRDLVHAVEYALGPKRGRTHPATKSFQALRIAVNDELGALEAGLAHRGRPARTRRAAGRHRIPLARRSARQAVLPRGRHRRGAARRADSQADRAVARGVGPQSARPKCQTAHGRAEARRRSTSMSAIAPSRPAPRRPGCSRLLASDVPDGCCSPSCCCSAWRRRPTCSRPAAR